MFHGHGGGESTLGMLADSEEMENSTAMRIRFVLGPKFLDDVIDKLIVKVDRPHGVW